jgi:nucleoside-diphosphate-sugar epimerase
MTNRTISILGCGWLGKKLGAALASSGYEVRGSTTRIENTDGLRSAGIIPFVYSVGNNTDEAHSLFQTDVLIISLPQLLRANKGEEYVQQISEVVAGARRGSVNKIVLFSTTSVYPDVNGEVNEEDADPDHPVARAERVVQLSGIPNTILRFAGLFGPGREPGRFLGSRQNVPGAASPVNLIHSDDCIEIVKRIIELNAWGHVFNACADDHPSKKDFYTKAAVIQGTAPPVFSDAAADYKIVRNARLKSVLRYSMIHRLV